MEVSQLSLARMLLSCFLGGVLMGLIYEILLLPRLLFFGELSCAARRLQLRMALPSPLCPVWRSNQEPHSAAVIRNRLFSTLLLAVADTLFCFLSAVLLLLLLYATNHGAFRLIAPVAMLSGVLLIRATLLRPLSGVIQWVYVLLRALLVWCVALLCYPFLRILRALWHRTAGCRQHLKDRYRQCRARRVQRKAERKHKKEYSDQESSNIENTMIKPKRAAPDGRRVFCAGNPYAGRE